MDDSVRITRKILLSILEGDKNVSNIRVNTGLHPKTLSIYLKRLGKQGLIEVKTRGWKKGKAKPCSITNAGIKWLINIPVNETLQVLSQIAGQMKNPKNRKVFKNVQAKRYSRNRKIVQDYFIERFLKEEKSPVKYLDGLDLTDPDQPFREALRKLLSLHLYLSSSDDRTPNEVESSIEKDFVLFAPHMTFVFSWHPGAFPELEYQLKEVDNYYRRESEKLEQRGKNEMVLKETHLLGLERVDEKYYDEYVKASHKKRREKILAQIEDEVGWSVGIHLRALLMGREEEIEKYIEELQRPSLRRFISLFENHGNK